MRQLSGLDLAFVCLDGGERPMHVGAVLVFDPPRPVHPARIAHVLAARAATIPELTRSVRATWWPPGGAAWAEDASFAAERHVHTHRLPRLHREDQLAAMVATLMAEPLPASRPAWQLHVISGIRGGRVAVLIKLHHALADGAGVLAVAGGLLDEGCGAPQANGHPEQARPAHSGLGRAATGLASDLASWAQQVGRVTGIAAATLTAARPSAFLSGASTVLAGSPRRQADMVRLDADALHRVRKKLGGTLNDVVLATVAGGLHQWLRRHSGPAGLDDDRGLRAFIPVSLRARRGNHHPGGNQLSGYLCELPIDEPDPLARLHAATEAMQRNKTAGPTRGPGAFPLIAEALPGAVHRVATPLLGRAAPLLFDTMVTTVPLPDIPLSLDGAPLREIYPLAPLASGQPLSIATAVYRGSVHVGLLTDPHLLPHGTALGTAIADAASELHDAAQPTSIPDLTQPSLESTPNGRTPSRSPAPHRE